MRLVELSVGNFFDFQFTVKIQAFHLDPAYFSNE